MDGSWWSEHGMRMSPRSIFVLQMRLVRIYTSTTVVLLLLLLVILFHILVISAERYDNVYMMHIYMNINMMRIIIITVYICIYILHFLGPFCMT